MKGKQYLILENVYIRRFLSSLIWIPKWKIYTVKPVLRGHLWDKQKVALYDKWPLKWGSIYMKVSMIGQEKKNVLLIQVTV